MATVAGKLTLAEFEKQFGNCKPYHEFWDGTAVQKSMPTLIHGLLQKILMRLLDELGLFSASEVRCKIGASLELLPDVIALTRLTDIVYPVDPPLVCIEILSPGDSAQMVWKKCGAYANWGVREIYVVDPDARKVRRFDGELDSFTNVAQIRIEGHGALATERLWEELDRQLAAA